MLVPDLPLPFLSQATCSFVRMDSDCQAHKVLCRSLASFQAADESPRDPCPHNPTSSCLERNQLWPELGQPNHPGPHAGVGDDKNPCSSAGNVTNYYTDGLLGLSDAEMLVGFRTQSSQVGSDTREDQIQSPVLSYSTISPVNATSPPSSVSSSPPRLRADSLRWGQTEEDKLLFTKSHHIHDRGSTINTELMFGEILDIRIDRFPRPGGRCLENDVEHCFNRSIYSSYRPTHQLQIQQQNAPQFLIFRKDKSSCKLVDPFYPSFRAPSMRRSPLRLEKRNTADLHELTLEREWEVYFDLGRRKNVPFLRFLSHVHFVCSFHTVEGFWRFFNNIPNISKMPKYFNLRLVPANSQPVQDDSCSIGGKIVITGKNVPRVLNDIWLRCCLSLIGETMDMLDKIDCVILAMRPDRGRINLRVNVNMEIEAIKELINKLRENLEFDSSIRIHYVPSDR